MAPAKSHTKTVDISDATLNLSKLIVEVESGEEITISRDGRSVARLVPYHSARASRTPGAWAGKVTIGDDFDGLSDSDAWFHT